MAWEAAVFDIPGLIAGEDFSSAGSLSGYQSTGQFLFVYISGDLTVKHCASVKQRMVGISQGNSKLGQALQVRAIGVSKLVAGATILAGQAIGTDANGKGVPKSETATGANYGDFVAGIALEGCAAASLFPILLSGQPYRI